MPLIGNSPVRVTPVVPLEDLIPRLADEGIPIAAIARATRQPRDAVLDRIRDAVDSGVICDIPASDWPPGVSRSQRTAPAPTKKRGLVDDDVVMKCIRFFRVTQLQACFVAVLLIRDEVSKETLHQIIEQQRGSPDEETDLKMVDVVMCNLRKRLKTFGISVATIWARGYCLEKADKARTQDIIYQRIEAPAFAAASEPAPVPEQGETLIPINEGIIDVFRLAIR